LSDIKKKYKVIKWNCFSGN